MRRFLIWSGLAAGIGLLLAVAAVWAYNHFYARFQPVTIDRNQASIQQLLDQASWVSSGSGDQPVYVVGYRDSSPTFTYLTTDVAKLQAGGADVRVLMFARADREGAALSTPAERATIAELWLNRDWELYRRWTATPAKDWSAGDLAPADGNLARTAVVEASRQFTEQLGRLLREAGVRPDWPLVIWRDREGFLKACACSNDRSWAFIRDDLGAPDTVGEQEGVFDPDASALSQDAETGLVPQDQGLPYPDLPLASPSDVVAPPGRTGVATPGAAPPPAPQTGPASQPQRQAPRPAPERAQPRTRPQNPAQPPPLEEDTRFY